jgi:hypothetical protein
MAKFNKDTFLNDITAKVQSAIDKNLITREDMKENELERLHGFIQYELLQYIEDRKFAIDVLKDFNYDEKVPWENLQQEYGVFKSLLDIALVNLWKFLAAEGATKFEYYNHNNKQDGKPMLDMIHDMEDIPNPDKMDASGDTAYEPYPGGVDPDAPKNEPENFNEFDDAQDDGPIAPNPMAEAPKRRIRLAR